ncbi:unnamed protein product [Prunus armeniaca]
MQNMFSEENVKWVNANLRMDFHNSGSNELFGFCMEMLGSLVFCISTVFMLLLPSSVIKPENVGLILSYRLPLNGVLFWAIYMSCFVKNKMVSVERIKQFINIPSEAAWEIKDRVPPSNWPSHGNVELRDLQVVYLQFCISPSIHGGEKIGVVGRTGSRKSTLIQVFFRLVEPSGGKIIIDGIDITTIGLHDIRSRFGSFLKDLSFLKELLERCQLKDVVAAKPDELNSLVADDGDNWSVGQRQLLCLGRVMLKHSRLLFMDEATASVDSQDKCLIGLVLRTSHGEISWRVCVASAAANSNRIISSGFVALDQLV